MAKLCVQEKISKINAELARLELEMELDHHGGDSGSVGSSFLKKITNMVVGDGTAEIEPAQRSAFEALLNAAFEKIGKTFDPKGITHKKDEVKDLKRVLSLFKPGTGSVSTGFLLGWDCLLGARPFYVFLRVYKKKIQYSVVRLDGMAQKDFSVLEYSDGSSADAASVDLFIERIARAIVKGADIENIVK
jgi:hypothetical protein